jgi:hypothetical protein
MYMNITFVLSIAPRRASKLTANWLTDLNDRVCSADCSVVSPS